MVGWWEVGGGLVVHGNELQVELHNIVIRQCRDGNRETLSGAIIAAERKSGG